MEGERTVWPTEKNKQLKICFTRAVILSGRAIFRSYDLICACADVGTWDHTRFQTATVNRIVICANMYLYVLKSFCPHFGVFVHCLTFLTFNDIIFFQDILLCYNKFITWWTSMLNEATFREIHFQSSSKLNLIKHTFQWLAKLVILWTLNIIFLRTILLCSVILWDVFIACNYNLQRITWTKFV